MGFNTGAATVHPTTTATNHDRDTEYDTSTVDIINNDDLKENRDGGDGDYYDNNNNNNNNNIQQKKLLKGDFKEYKGKFASCFKSLEFALIALLTTITMLALVSMAVIGIGFYWSTIKSNMERSRKIAFTELTQVTTLSNAKVASHIKGMYQTRQLLHDEQHEDWAVYQIGEPIESKSDEWMYEMQEQERLGRWTKFSQAFELYRNKNYSEAFSAFESYLEQDPEDPVTMKLMAECQDRL